MGSKRKTQFSDPRNNPNPNAGSRSANPYHEPTMRDYDGMYGSGGGGGGRGGFAGLVHVPVIVPSGDEPGSDHPPVIDKDPLPAV